MIEMLAGGATAVAFVVAFCWAMPRFASRMIRETTDALEDDRRTCDGGWYRHQYRPVVSPDARRRLLAKWKVGVN